jgi:endonuclease/exonuclease/phosphatase family metal-dependent hydrolase
MVRVNADIYALQEVQNCAILQRLVDAMTARHSTGYNFFLVPGTDTATGQNTAIVTRVDIVAPVTRSANRAAWPIAGNTCNYNGGQSGTTGVSKHTMASFVVNNRRIGLFTAHYLAFPTTSDRCVQREGQATVARGLINEMIAAGEQVIVLGDFNDYSDRVPDVVNNSPTSRVLRIMREGVLPGVEIFGNFSKTAGGNAVLYEASQQIAQSQRYTAVYDNGNNISQIDHILVSEGLQTLIAAVTIDHTDAPNVVSDHWPIIVDFRI